jgi:hypothetical protein
MQFSLRLILDALFTIRNVNFVQVNSDTCRLLRVVLHSGVWKVLDYLDYCRLGWVALNILGECYLNTYRRETFKSYSVGCFIPNLKLQSHMKLNETAYLVQNKLMLHTAAINTVCLSQAHNLICHLLSPLLFRYVPFWESGLEFLTVSDIFSSIFFLSFFWGGGIFIGHVRNIRKWCTELGDDFFNTLCILLDRRTCLFTG